MSAPSYIIAVPLLTIVAVATFTDLRARRIPNALSLGGAALGVLANATAFGSTGVLLAVLGWVLCLVCFLPFYVTGGMAAGDVKLMATVGAFLGPLSGFVACAVALMAGGSLGGLYMVVRRRAAAGAMLEKIPYALAIAVGATAAVLQPAWVTALIN